MNTVWIALVIHTWFGFNTGIEVRAYKTEVECNRAINSGKNGQCASVDYLLHETYDKKQGE